MTEKNNVLSEENKEEQETTAWRITEKDTPAVLGIADDNLLRTVKGNLLT